MIEKKLSRSVAILSENDINQLDSISQFSTVRLVHLIGETQCSPGPTSNCNPRSSHTSQFLRFRLLALPVQDAVPVNNDFMKGRFRP